MASSRHSLPALLTFLSALRASGGCTFADWNADAAAGCAGYASGTCQALARCGELFLSPYGSYEACQTELSEGCTHSLGLPDVYGSGEGAAACGAAMINASCDDLTNGELPVGCGTPVGKRSDGRRCQVGAQCASGRCAEIVDDWGACRERGEPGEDCLSKADCRNGLVCSTKGSCVVLSKAGEACGIGAPCRAPLACVAGSCTSVDVERTCQTFGDTLCKRLEGCSTSFVRTVYGDLRSCAARNAWSCKSSLGMTEGLGVSAGVAGCSRALDAVSCNQLMDHALPPACQLVPGPRADGRACSTDSQCASERCARGNGAACGVCTPLGTASAACSGDTDCMDAFICSGGSCRAPSALNAACDAAQRCAHPWVCAGGTCTEAVGLGAACSYPADRCDKNQGLMCNAAGKCEPWLLGNSGQACNQTKNGWAACGAGSSCATTSEGDTCLGPLPDGSPCKPGQAPYCLAPAQCLGGVCGLPSTVDCP
ncbi:MAG TPA: hypothetical protein VJV78_45200 [Polyangiales bacterium]|nr:hypothetical protein [Polyangiales bacterium]